MSEPEVTYVEKNSKKILGHSPYFDATIPRKSEKVTLPLNNQPQPALVYVVYDVIHDISYSMGDIVHQVMVILEA